MRQKRLLSSVHRILPYSFSQAIKHPLQRPCFPTTLSVPIPQRNMHSPLSHDLSALPVSSHSQRTRQSQSIFQNPFSPQPRQTRSLSTTSTSSFQSCFSNQSSSLNEVLAKSFSRSGSMNSTRRPSCFSLADVEEEKAEFGEECVGLLEPRPRMGWWGVREVLEEDTESRRGSLS